jgi:hypothetical protein
MHLFLKLFILAKHYTCFGRSFRPSSGVRTAHIATGTYQTDAASPEVTEQLPEGYGQTDNSMNRQARSLNYDFTLFFFDTFCPQKTETRQLKW